MSSATVNGMGHGVASAADGEERCGEAGPFHFDVGIASSVRILEFFGITAEGGKADDAGSLSAAVDFEQRQSPAYLGAVSLTRGEKLAS